MCVRDMTAEQEVESRAQLSDNAEVAKTPVACAVSVSGCTCSAENNDETIEDCILQCDSGLSARMMTSESACAENDHLEDGEKVALCQGRNQKEASLLTSAEHPFCFESDHLALRNNSEYVTLT